MLRRGKVRRVCALGAVLLGMLLVLLVLVVLVLGCLRRGWRCVACKQRVEELVSGGMRRG